MTDKELLELAAKAAGIEIDKSEFNGGGAGNDGFDIMGNAVLDWHNGTTWNPLTDDGDALRLAVKIGLSHGLDVILTNRSAHADLDGAGVSQNWFAEEHDGDPFAATRRAIVRSAAEIGKAA